MKPDIAIVDDVIRPDLNPNILILGHGRHGKNFVAEVIRDLTGLTFASSSRSALDAIYPTLSFITGITDKEVLYSQRNQDDYTRLLWKHLISLYNTPYKGALCDKILSENDMYVGLRSYEEYEVVNHKFDYIFWVHAWERCGKKDPSLEIDPTPSMIPINNDGTKEDTVEIVKEKLAELNISGSYNE